METIKPHFETPKVEQEISLEEIKDISSAWSEMVLGDTESDQDFPVDKIELKKWLADSLRKEIDILVKKWDLAADQELIEKISQTQDIEEKADSELGYIENVLDKIAQFVAEFKKDEKRKHTRWNSFPAAMKQNNSFNCVGASLIGENLLSQAGIKNYYGNSAGHVVCIAQLANNDWWYLDFRNGESGTRKISPEIDEIEGSKILRINDPVLEYKIIAISDQDSVPAFVLDNLDALKMEAVSDKVPDDIEKEYAKEYLDKFGKWYQKLDFHKINQEFNPDIVKTNDSMEMEQERKRVKVVRKAKEKANQHLASLEFSKRKEVFAEAKIKLEMIEQYFKTKDKSCLDELSEELRKVLSLQEEGIEAVEAEYSAIREEIQAFMLATIQDFEQDI